MTDSLRLPVLAGIACVLAWWLTTDAVWPYVVQALAYVWGHGGG